MGDSILAGVGDEVLITVCCGAVITFAGIFTFARLQNSSSQTGSTTEAEDHVHHSYNNEVCPICLSPHRLAVETNCGHKFCGSCLRTYLNNRTPGDFSIFNGRISCPMCRQDVNIMLTCFTPDESQLLEFERDRETIQTTVHEYNIRFGNGSRNLMSYIRDFPVLFRHMLMDFFSFGGLVWMFRVRITACIVTAIMYLLFPLDIIPEAVFGFFGLLDDLIVIFLCAIYVSIIYRRYVINRGARLGSDTETSQ